MKNTIRILYVDDSSIDRELVREVLEKEGKDFELVEASTLGEFKTKLQCGEYDLVITDFKIFDADGFQIFDIVREHSRQLPVIMLTGTGSEEIAIEALKRGVADYVLKTPKHILHLSQTIRTVLEKKMFDVERKKIYEVMQTSEEQYRKLITTLPDAVFLHQEGRFIFVNPSGIKLLGYANADSLLGKQIIDVVHPDFRDIVKERVRKSLEEGGPIPMIEEKFLRVDGASVDVEVSATSLTMDGKPTMMVVAHDITARKRAAESVRSAEEKYKNIFENATEGIYQTTIEGRYITVNPSLVRMFGFTSSEEMISTITNLNTQFYIDSNRRAEFQRILTEHGSVSDFESEVVRKDGTVFWISENARTVKDNNGKLLYYEGTIVDITQRKRANEVIQKTQESLEAAQALAHLGNWEFDLSTLQGWVSKEFLQLFHQDPLRRGTTLKDFISWVHPDDRRIVIDANRRLLETNEIYKIEFRTDPALGEIRSIYGESRVVRDSAGRAISTKGIIQDITEQKQREQKLRESEERYRDLVENSQDLICTHDLNGKILSVNLAISKMLEYSVDEIVGMHLQDILTPGTSNAYKNYIDRIRKERKASGLMHLQSRSGKIRIWEYNNNLHEDGVRMPFVRAMARDVTERVQLERARRQSENQFRTLFDTAPIGIGVADMRGNLLEYNDSILRPGGYSYNDIKIIGSVSALYYDEKQRTAALELFRRQGFVKDFQTQFKRKDGTPYDVMLSLSHTVFRGQPCIQAMVEDITERKQAEDALRESQQQHTQLINTVEGIVWEADAQTFQFTFVSDQAEKLLGYPIEQWKGPGFWVSHIYEADRAKSVEYCLKCVEAKVQHTLEYRMVAADERIVWLRDIVTVIERPKNPPLLRGIMVDITERKQSELLLISSENRFRALIEYAADGFTLNNAQGQIIYASPSTERILGYTPVEILKYNPSDLTHPDDLPKFLPLLLDLMEKPGRVIKTQYRFRHKDGSWRWLESTISNMFAVPNVEAMVFNYRDITERVQTEQKIQRLNRVYAVLSNINQAIVRMSDKQQLLDEVCRVVVDDGKLDVVYIGLINQATGGFEIASTIDSKNANFSLEEFIKIRNEFIMERETDPNEIVLATNKSFLSNDISNDERIPKAMRRYAASIGLQSAGLFPLTMFGKTVGNFALASTEMNLFSSDEVELLDELAMDISFALENIAKEEERVKRRKQLHLQSTALQSASNAIVITNKDGTIEWANTAFTTLTGYTLRDAAGKNPRELVKSGVHPESFYKTMWDTITSGNVWRGELINKRKDGTLYSEEQTITPVKDEKGNITHFIGIKLDITERKRIQIALENSESRYKILSHLSSDFSYSCISMGKEGYKIDWISEAFYNLSEYSEEELRQHPCWMFTLHQSDREEALRMVKNINIGQLKTSESRLVSKSGKVYWIVNRFECFADSTAPGGKRLYGTVQNITERKELQNQFFRTQRLESLGTLAGGIAHDLNNVLGPIMLAVEFLRRKESDPKSLDILSTLESSAQRGKNIVKQILTFARGTSDLQQSIIQPRHIIGEVESILRETISKNIEIKTYVPKDLWTVKGDPTHIHQMIMNLAVNARDAMPHGGVLTLSASNTHLTEKDLSHEPDVRAGKFILIEVKDTGIGISDEFREKIFDPFFTTKEAGKGTGLGLSTVYKLVKSHGGFVTFSSSVGKGTTFKIAIPAVDEEETKPLIGDVIAPSIKSGLTALVVDDEIDVRTSVSEILATYNINVIQAENGAEAISTFVQHKDNIGVVITDMMMPIIDGAGVIAAIRKMSPATKIIMMSGLMSDIHNLTQANKYDLFIQKPFGAVELIDAIAKLEK